MARESHPSQDPGGPQDNPGQGHLGCWTMAADAVSISDRPRLEDQSLLVARIGTRWKPAVEAPGSVYSGRGRGNVREESLFASASRPDLG